MAAAVVTVCGGRPREIETSRLVLLDLLARAARHRTLILNYDCRRTASSEVKIGRHQQLAEVRRNFIAPARESIDAGGWLNQVDDRFGKPAIVRTVGVDVEQIHFVIRRCVDIHHSPYKLGR
jgi:hypothetical protein